MKQYRSLKMKVVKVPVSSLQPLDVDRLYQIYSSSYDSTDRATFDEDLSQKQYVFLGRDTGTKEIVGFSTLEMKNFDFENQKMTYFFSGDTMILPEYWGQKSLHMAFAMNALTFKLKNPNRRVFWYLICMGYRTYMIMAKNCPTHFPRHDQTTPAFYKKVIDYISTTRYGKSYDTQLGVVIPDKPTTLSSHVAPIDESVLHVPQIKFLATNNPGYKQGHEMACVAELDINMLSYWSKKSLKQWLQKSPLTKVIQTTRQKWAMTESDSNNMKAN